MARQTDLDPERPRGIFSPRDRKYLLGQSDIEKGTQYERDIRADIRERMWNSLIDFYMLWEYVEDRDFQQTFDPTPRGSENVADLALARDTGIIYALGVFYRIAEQGDDIPGTQDFATYLQAGVRMVYAERLRTEDDQLWSRPPVVDFKVEEPPSIDIDTMFAKIEAVHERGSEALDALTQEEMMVVISLAVHSDKPEEMSDFLALFLDWVHTQYGPDQWRVPSPHEIGNETLADLIDKANLTSEAVDQKSDVSDGNDAENS